MKKHYYVMVKSPNPNSQEKALRSLFGDGNIMVLVSAKNQSTAKQKACKIANKYIKTNLDSLEAEIHSWFRAKPRPGF